MVSWSVPVSFLSEECTYEVGQMDVTLGVEENIIRFHIAMDDALGMYIFQSTAQLSKPKPNRVLREAFPRNMESEIAPIHKIHHNVTSRGQHKSGCRGLVGHTCTRYPESCISSYTKTDGSNARAFAARG